MALFPKIKHCGKNILTQMSKMGMVNWGVGRKIAPLNQNTSTVVTWDMLVSRRVNAVQGKSKCCKPCIKQIKNGRIFT